MNPLVRTLLRPVAHLAGMQAAAQLRSFLHVHEHAREVQDAVLRDLVGQYAATRFGRDHRLASVKTYEDFRSAVPVRDYDAMSPYLQSVYEGQTDALFPAGTNVLLFALTSGTTGEPKRIPVTDLGLAHYRRGWNVFGIKAYQDHPDAWLRRILQINSPSVDSHSPAGVPCGAISGLLAGTQKRIVRRMYVPSPCVSEIADCTARYYTILRLAAGQDVAITSAPNPSTLLRLFAVGSEHIEALLRDLADGTLTPPGALPDGMLARLRLRKEPCVVRRIEAGLARDGRLLATHLWKLSFLMNWTGGTLGLYLPELRRLTGNAPIRDIGLLASEGRMSTPLGDDSGGGVAEVQGAFLEFIPAEDIDAADPTVLRSHELEAGAEYFILVTNHSGLWRYNIRDRVRVTGYFGESPVIAFLSKGAHTTSLTGEKLTEDQVVSAVAAASNDYSLAIQRFTAQPHFAATPYYLVTVESEGALPDGFAKTVDQKLQAVNVEYSAKRRSGRLGCARTATDSPTRFCDRELRILQARSGRAEQYKHQYLITEVLSDPPAS